MRYLGACLLPRNPPAGLAFLAGCWQALFQEALCFLRAATPFLQTFCKPSTRNPFRAPFRTLSDAPELLATSPNSEDPGCRPKKSTRVPPVGLSCHGMAALESRDQAPQPSMAPTLKCEAKCFFQTDGWKPMASQHRARQ